jgi:hypothetical protein
MEIVIIDSRDGGTRLTEEAREAIGMSNIVLYIEQDNVVRVVVPEEPITRSHHGRLFYAQTEEQASAELAAQHFAGRVGNPRSEHNNAAALRKGRAVWDMMEEDQTRGK